MTISMISPSSIRLSSDKRDSSSSNLPANIEEDTQSVSSSDSGVSADSIDHHHHGHGHGHSHGGHGHSHTHNNDDSSSDCSGAGGGAHKHSHDEKYQKGRRAEKVLWAVAALSAVFIAAEFVGGFWAQSLAIMTDAGHMLSDLLSFIISIFAIRCARLPASKRLSFGYERAEVLGALTSVIILWVLTTVLVVVAIQRIVNNEHEVDADVMLITAGVGVLFNIVMGLVLHFGTGGHGHTHGGHSSHGHAHDGKNVNVRAALIHVIGDLVQSIGVLIAALIIRFTGWTLADPICTFLFSIIVLFTTVTVMRDIFFVLMEATPSHYDLSDVKKALSALEGVKGVHDLHLWSIGMDKTAFSVHLALESPNRAMENVAEARSLIRRRFGVAVATVQVEPFDEKIDSCDTCQQQETA
ncbi:Zinc transporter ttm-1 [Caenorhabditis elegans]|uniref:Zinc transporter ttm-1 n=1 Tax=Caenorhabditis elegans TaxID=6239 RepID=TTM1_CAEEL|nr:Zinc transporter ttm-1 [Caenorhabditis elegans]O45923.1 RecName: Full=Zinc transporter ttm-1; AltName: Full=Toxin-regulated target of MAPK 1; AltName: Full=Toxin-regulated target of p38MAPK [Caenorhabditis elegans]CAA16328.1 Zinc transporter ttm-1 [Caenorhabditis elegans]|eukprot:NP_499692.1 Toxin-regulated Targets of MAPK [Caenorhabditis elegans]